MHQEGILGVLGGMGPQATNTFYQRIIDRTQAESDQEHLRVLIWSDAKIPDRTAGILGTPDQARLVWGAQDAGGAVGNLRIAPDEHPQVLLVGLGLGAVDDPLVKGIGGLGAHTAQDA